MGSSCFGNYETCPRRAVRFVRGEAPVCGWGVLNPPKKDRAITCVCELVGQVFDAGVYVEGFAARETAQQEAEARSGGDGE